MNSAGLAVSTRPSAAVRVRTWRATRMSSRSVVLCLRTSSQHNLNQPSRSRCRTIGRPSTMRRRITAARVRSAKPS